MQRTVSIDRTQFYPISRFNRSHSFKRNTFNIGSFIDPWPFHIITCLRITAEYSNGQ